MFAIEVIVQAAKGSSWMREIQSLLYPADGLESLYVRSLIPSYPISSCHHLSLYGSLVSIILSVPSGSMFYVLQNSIYQKISIQPQR